jgi:hypothetical protein
MFILNPLQVTQYRANLIAGPDHPMIVDVGYFLIWYSAAELSITNLLAYASGVTDLDVFDSLVRGMDLQTKIERLNRIRKRRGGVGPNLAARLKYMNAKCRPIRNRLAHCAMFRSDKQQGNYLASTLGTLPWDDMGQAQPPGIKHNPPVIYSDAQLLGWGGWLAAFCQDASQALNHARDTGEFEIANPLTPEPPEDEGTPAPPRPRAKPDKPAQTESGKEK